MHRHSQRREPTPVLLEELEYTVSCITFFDDKQVWFDVNFCHLHNFKIHEYNAKSIKAITKEAERMKSEFELSSCVATISGARMKQTAKSLEDPNDWETIRRVIERYMKDKIRHIRVDYVVNYIKKERACIESGECIMIMMMMMMKMKVLNSKNARYSSNYCVLYIDTNG